MRILITFLFILILEIKGLQRVVGGHEAPKEFGKYHVSLQNVTGHHVCGGTIVAHRYLVTAAHCVLGANPRYIRAVVGTTDLDKGGLNYDIKEIHIHEQYNNTLKRNDIAVLKIAGLFDLQIAEMLKLDENVMEGGELVLFTGFGAKKPHGESSRKMHVLNLTVFDQETCKYAMRYTRKVYDSMFCTFTGIGQGTCHGNSGGPLTIGNRLVGIVSWGIPCAVGFPDVHTRISSYVKWIRKITQKNICNCPTENSNNYCST